MSLYKSNKQKVKPTYIKEKRTDINIKQADAQKKPQSGVLEMKCARCPVKSYTDHLIHSSYRIKKSQLVYKTKKSSLIQKYTCMHGLKMFYVLLEVRMQNGKYTLR